MSRRVMPQCYWTAGCFARGVAVDSKEAMTPLRRVLIGTALAVCAAVAAWSFLSVYSPRKSEYDYLTPALRLIKAGMALDSVGLDTLDVAAPVALWALSTGRSNPGLLRALQSGLVAQGGARNHDRSLVWYHANGFKGCNGVPLRVRFSGLPATTRIEEVIVSCDSLHQ